MAFLKSINCRSCMLPAFFTIPVVPPPHPDIDKTRKEMAKRLCFSFLVSCRAALLSDNAHHQNKRHFLLCEVRKIFFFSSVTVFKWEHCFLAFNISFFPFTVAFVKIAKQHIFKGSPDNLFRRASVRIICEEDRGVMIIC